jgi:hypothetical protein
MGVVGRNEQETETPTMPPIVLKESNLSAKAADVAATTIVMIITTVEWPRLPSAGLAKMDNLKKVPMVPGV